MQRGPIDCDVHPAVPGIAALTRFLEPYWREQVESRGTAGLDLSSFPVNAPDLCRADWRVAGQKPLVARASHAGFDSDVAVIGRTIERITGGPLAMPVTDLRSY